MSGNIFATEKAIELVFNRLLKAIEKRGELNREYTLKLFEGSMECAMKKDRMRVGTVFHEGVQTGMIFCLIEVEDERGEPAAYKIVMELAGRVLKTHIGLDASVAAQKVAHHINRYAKED